ncbi:heavy metal-binding domain-containing protein [Flavitalea antarctica]
MRAIIPLIIIIFFASTGLFAQSKAGKTDTTHQKEYYTCPNHPDVVNHVAGKCSKCGTQLNRSSKEQMKAEVVKSYICPVHMDVTSHDPRKCPKCGRKMNLSSKEQMKAEVTKAYTCPMHPEVALSKDGLCPKCGSTLIEKKKNR